MIFLKETGTRLAEVNEMLDHNPHPFEEGFKRLADGTGLVAVRTPMPRCSGAMIDWWFGHIETTEQYRVWHPADHVYSGWKGERGTGRYIGGTHLIHERLGTDKIHKLKLNFRDPGKVLDKSRFAKAGIGTVIYGRCGPLNLPLWSAHVVHMVHDSTEGCVMRSRFWLGDISPAIPILAGAMRRDMTSDESLAGLARHCREEMTILAGFLPGLYRQHTVKAA